MRRILAVTFIATWIMGQALGQIGGRNAYQFLDLSPSARLTGLGNTLIAVKDNDVTLAYQNPAALHAGMDEALAFNNSFYLGGINHGYAGYGFHLAKAGLSMHTGIKYVSYGHFDGRGIHANHTGSFKSSEYAITAGVGRAFSERLSVGANLKIISSQLESFNSWGLSVDLAGMYVDTASRFSATFVFKNAGVQLSTYAGERERLPFEIQAGFSKRLKYLPLRISVIGVQLQRWNILYDDPNQNDQPLLFGEQPGEPSPAVAFMDNLFRHLVINGEFLFGKKENFQLRVGYSQLRRAELSVSNLRSMAGFSAGASLKIKQFRLDYGLGFYGTGANAHHLGLSTNFGQFRK